MRRLARLARPASLLALTVLAACTLHRREAPPSLLGTAAPVGFPADIRHLSIDGTRVDAAAIATFDRERRASTGAPLRILALSGGGAGGAFGAGALVGLTHRGERQPYDVVTGVSTGALLAPFAFLGPAWDGQMADAFTSTRTEQHLARGVLSLILESSSSRSKDLKALVDHYITADLVKAVAQEAATGRVLLAVTTDLDKQEPVIWNLGLIAAVGGERARRLFRDVLVASASVPGLFSPVLIRVKDGGHFYDEMHVDGNTTTSMLVAPDAAYMMPLDPESLRGASVYVLMNGPLRSLPTTTPRALMNILSRSFSTALTLMARAQLVEARQLAQTQGMSLRVTAIPAVHPAIGALDFHVSSMRSLFDYGRRCAEKGQLWMTADQLLAPSAVDGAHPDGPDACPGIEPAASPPDEHPSAQLPAHLK